MMISPELFMYGVIGYLGFCGSINVVLAVFGSEKKVRPTYGPVEGIAGLVFIGIAVLMAVL